MMSITPGVLAAAGLSFLLCFVCHLVVWRVFPSLRRMNVLAVIFLGVPAACFFSAAVYVGGGPVAWKLVYIFIGQTAVSCAYMLTYPALETGSPSLKMLAAAASSREGMDVDQFENIFSGRIHGKFTVMLAREGLVALSGDAPRLTEKGRLVTCFFGVYRKSLGIPEGEG